MAAHEPDNPEPIPGAPDAGRDAGAGPSAWAFRLAVLRHHGIVYRTALAMLRNTHEAEDVTQDVFLRFWQQGARVRRPREWLLRVGRNACLDRLRAASRRGLHVVDGAGDAEGADGRDPAWHCEQDELGDRLAALIAQLPEPQRSLVVLFDVHGLTGEACARILEINVNQVKVYLHRARRRLRRALEQSS